MWLMTPIGFFSIVEKPDEWAIFTKTSDKKLFRLS